MKTLFELPEILKSGMRLKSGNGTFGIIVTTKNRTAKGDKLYRLKYTFKGYAFTGSMLFTRDDLVKAGCRLALSRKEASEKTGNDD